MALWFCVLVIINIIVNTSARPDIFRSIYDNASGPGAPVLSFGSFNPYGQYHFTLPWASGIGSFGRGSGYPDIIMYVYFVVQI